MAPKRQQVKKTYDYSKLEKGMRCQVESDGAYYAAEIVQVSDSKNRSKAPVKVSFQGYEGYDEWVSGAQIRSKAMTVTVERPERPPAAKPTLYYFPFAGRGELTKLIAAAGGVKLEMGEMPEDRKDLCAECGAAGTAIPVLKHGDLKMCQSAAIQNYIALIGPKFRKLPARARAVDMMWCAHVEDMIGDCAKTGIFGLLFGGDTANFKKDELKAALEKWFGLLETLAPAEGFVTGGKIPTASDCCAVLLFRACAPFTHFVKNSDFDPAPYAKLKSLADRACETKGLKEYVESSASLKADPFTK